MTEKDKKIYDLIGDLEEIKTTYKELAVGNSSIATENALKRFQLLEQDFYFLLIK